VAETLSPRKNDLLDDLWSGRPFSNDFAGAIGSMLEERWFSSSNMLCHHFRIGRAMYLQILHDKLGLKKIHLCWLPHALSIDQKTEKVSSSRLFPF
jgi:hypothetical protein